MCKIVHLTYNITKENIEQYIHFHSLEVAFLHKKVQMTPGPGRTRARRSVPCIQDRVHFLSPEMMFCPRRIRAAESGELWKIRRGGEYGIHGGSGGREYGGYMEDPGAEKSMQLVQYVTCLTVKEDHNWFDNILNYMRI